MAKLHPSSIVESGATLGDGVEIGPFCHVGSDVVIGDNCRLISHVSIMGRTRIASHCTLYPFSSIGHIPQDLKYAGEPSELVIGERTVIREQVTINTGTRGGGMITSVGADCLLMVGVHIAHDCQIGDRVILANNVTLAGHVNVGEGAVIGGLSAVLQFVRIGEGAMIGGMSGVEQDVIPFGLVKGDRAALVGLNLIGLKRNSMPSQELGQLRSIYDSLFGPIGEPLSERAARLRELAEYGPAGKALIEFVLEPSQHGICRPN